MCEVVYKSFVQHEGLGHLCGISQLQQERDSLAKQQYRGFSDTDESSVNFQSDQISTSRSSTNNAEASDSLSVDSLLREFMENPALVFKSAEPERHIRSGVYMEPREFSRSRSRTVPRRIVIESF